MTPERAKDIALSAINEGRWGDARPIVDKFEKTPFRREDAECALATRRAFWLAAQAEAAPIPEGIREIVLSAPGERSYYQHDLLNGEESWSGSTLRGRARSYAGHYAASRQGLLDRIRTALEPEGWSADVPLVFDDESRRYTRKLVLTGPEGKPYIW